MAPPNPDLPGQPTDDGGRSPHCPASSLPHTPTSVNQVSRLRSDESWVEISSQPSSSSLSSAATDEIVTTGLRVQRDARGRRRRRLRIRGSTQPHLQIRPPGGHSSQEEYEESDSEEDQLMASSTENLVSGPLMGSAATHMIRGYPARQEEERNDDEDEDEDHDEEATALGVPSQNEVFTPQPNVFSHPPSSQSSQRPGPGSYFGPPDPHRQRQSAAHASRPAQHSPYILMSPSHHADHDAALRASLSTLLSCAAAARGLSKHGRLPGTVAGPSTLEPDSLRIIPESALPSADLKHESSQSDPSMRHGPTAGASNRPRSRDKGKRKASGIPGKGSKERLTKIPKRVLEDPIAPTLFTWVISAGVVVLVSAISFSAGYAMGKEVGRAEVSIVDTGDGRSCGKEAVRGLRRLRWSTSGAGVIPV